MCVCVCVDSCYRRLFDLYFNTREREQNTECILLFPQIKLEELGFTDLVSSLRMEYLSPITRLLYPDWGGSSLDSHKAFIVTYKEGEDVDLSYHYDNAEVIFIYLSLYRKAARDYTA